MSTKPLVLGLDIGGSKTEVALVEIGAGNDPVTPLGSGRWPRYQVLGRKRAPTHRQLGYASILATIVGLCRDVLQENGRRPEHVAAMGLGLPGSVCPQSGRMINGNSLVLKGESIAHDVARGLEFPGPCCSANDANCFVLAETLAGVGLEFADPSQAHESPNVAVGLILGTGAGGGCTIGGKLLVGRRGGACEFGHMVLYADGFPCYCGQRGCAEQYVSGPALEAAFYQRAYSQIAGRPSCQDILALYEAGEPIAVAVVKDYRRHLVNYLVSLAQVFDPHFFVLGGGLSNQPALCHGVEEQLAARRFIPDSSIPVLTHRLGDSAGVLGAAFLAAQSL